MSEEGLRAIGIPADFLAVEIDDFGYDSEAKDSVAEIIEDISGYMKRRLNLMLVGQPRVGKTMLASIITAVAYDAGWRCRFLPFAVYVRQLHKRLGLQSIVEHHTDYDALDRYHSLQSKTDSYFACDLLVLDDVGKENSTAYAVRELDYLLRRRHDHGQSTIVTTNLSPAQWAEIYGEGVDAFLNDAYRRIGVRNPVRD